MVKQSCTAGVYGIKDARGKIVRIGESQCIQTRAPRSARAHRECIGPVSRVVVLAREPNRAKRFRLQQELQRKHGVGPRHLPRCNPRLSGVG